MSRLDMSARQYELHHFAKGIQQFNFMLRAFSDNSKDHWTFLFLIPHSHRKFAKGILDFANTNDHIQWYVKSNTCCVLAGSNTNS